MLLSGFFSLWIAYHSVYSLIVRCLLDSEPAACRRLVCVRVGVSDDGCSLLLLETTPDLHWHAAAVVGGAAGRGPLPSTALVIDHSEGRWGVIAATWSVATEAVRSSKGQLVFTAELGEGLCEHGYLVSI